MKKLKTISKLSFLLVSVLILVMSFASCDKDSDSSSDSIEGKWFFSKTSIDGVEEDYPNIPGCTKDNLDFRVGGIYADTYYFPEDNCNFETSQGNWVKSGNKITVTDEFDVTEYTIVSLTSTTLKLSVVFDGVTYSAALTRN
jgi:hypothetical protein